MPHRCATGWPRCSATAPAFATPCFWRRRIARCRRMTMPALREIAELAAAFVPSRERQLETTTQGRAFIEIARSAWACDGLDEVIAALRRADRLSRRGRPRQRRARHSAGAGDARLPACGGVELDFRRRRLVPLGQTDSQRVLAQPRSRCRRHRQARARGSLDDLGSATFRADLASLRHETQYTRLFRS